MGPITVSPTQSLVWGGSMPPMYRLPATMANGQSVQALAATSNKGNGPGVTMPAEYGSGMRQPTSLRQLQSQQAAQTGPIEISAGVYVWPNGQQLTAAEMQALNLQDVVSQAPTTSAELLAQESAAATPATTATTTTSTSWLDENTITSSYTNGQVVLAGAAAFAVFWFLKKR
jgi:hypothetical protein